MSKFNPDPFKKTTKDVSKTIRLKQDAVDEIQVLAEQTGVTENAYYAGIIEKYLAALEAKGELPSQLKNKKRT